MEPENINTNSELTTDPELETAIKIQLLETTAKAYRDTVNDFLVEASKMFEEQKTLLDQSTIDIAERVNKSLEEATVRHQKSKERIRILKEKVNNLFS